MLTRRALSGRLEEACVGAPAARDRGSLRSNEPERRRGREPPSRLSSTARLVRGEVFGYAAPVIHRLLTILAVFALAELASATAAPEGRLGDLGFADAQNQVHHHHVGNASSHERAHASEPVEHESAVEAGGAPDDDHDCCGLCCGKGSPQPVAASLPDRWPDTTPAGPAALPTDVVDHLKDRASDRRGRPPPRAGPPPHLLGLRTFVLLI
jgi:hypothetical protein